MDVTGAEQAIAILNNFNYHPAPLFQTYSAGTPALVRQNSNFYTSEHAPEFVIVPPEYRIDQRLPNLEESFTGLILSQQYDPVLGEKGYRLLKRNANRKIELGPGTSGETTIGKPIEVNGGDWSELVMKENLVGRLVRFLWASPPVYVDVGLKQGGLATYRFIPSFGEAGFVVPADIVGLQVKPNLAARWCFKPRLEYKLRSTPSSGDCSTRVPIKSVFRDDE